MLTLEQYSAYCWIFSVSKLAEMAAVGLDMPAQFFSDAGKYGFVPLVTYHDSFLDSHAP
jgi:hypothetical protein